MWMQAVQVAGRAQWQIFRCFPFTTTAVYLDLSGSMRSACSFWKSIPIKRDWDLKLIGHHANRPIFTWQIHLPFDKKSQLCRVLFSRSRRMEWGHESEQNGNRYKSVYQKHRHIKNHRHAYVKFTLCHISFIHNSGQERTTKKRSK